MKVSKRKNLPITLALSAALGVGMAQTALGQDLTAVVESQQKQLDAQAVEIRMLKEQLQQILVQTSANTAGIAAKADKQELEKIAPPPAAPSKVGVKVYGQINRAGLWADNGDASKAYFVDNDNSSTRMGVEAKAGVTEGGSLGGRIEYELESNPSTKVNQSNENVNPAISLRHADGWYDDAGLGKISLGHGSTATDGTAEVDLSGTSVVTYSSVADLAGGQLWYNDETDSLGELVVGDVFNNMDGLSRRDRLRYDTPSWGGLKLSGSAIEDGAYDLAARYDRKFGDITLASALGFADAGDLASWDKQLSGSLSLLHTSGINLTFAAGNQDLTAGDRNDPTFWYAKLGYSLQVLPVGVSAFSVDYGAYQDFKKDEDEATALSFAYVQNLQNWGTELYLAYRLYGLDEQEGDLADINAVMAGARIKF